MLSTFSDHFGIGNEILRRNHGQNVNAKDFFVSKIYARKDIHTDSGHRFSCLRRKENNEIQWIVKTKAKGAVRVRWFQNAFFHETTDHI